MNDDLRAFYGGCSSTSTEADGGCLPLASEQLLNADVKQVSKVVEDGQIGASQSALPFGDGLGGNPHAIGYLSLCQSACPPPFGDAGTQLIGMYHVGTFLL